MEMSRIAITENTESAYIRMVDTDFAVSIDQFLCIAVFIPTGAPSTKGCAIKGRVHAPFSKHHIGDDMIVARQIRNGTEIGLPSDAIGEHIKGMIGFKEQHAAMRAVFVDAIIV